MSGTTRLNELTILVAARGAKRHRIHRQSATRPHPVPLILRQLGEMKIHNQPVGDEHTDDDGRTNVSATDSPTKGPLSLAASEMMKSGCWRNPILREAAQLAARHVHALEQIGDDGRARVFLAMVNGYRVRDRNKGSD
jgi:hypothetical protein